MYEIIKDTLKQDIKQMEHDRQFLNTLIKSTMNEELLESCLMDYAKIFKGHKLLACYGFDDGTLAQVVTATVKRQETHDIIV